MVKNQGDSENKIHLGLHELDLFTAVTVNSWILMVSRLLKDTVSTATVLSVKL
jgi:hypothetical protein